MHADTPLQGDGQGKPLPAVSLQRARIIEADHAFATHPDFGLTDAIAGRMLERYRFELELLAEQAPILRRLIAAVADPEIGHRVFTDPLIRIAMEEAFERFTQHAWSPDEARALEQTLDAALVCAADGLGYLEARLTTRLRVASPARAWLWSFEGSDDASVRWIQRCCRHGVEGDGQAETWTVRIPTAESAQHLGRASALLAALLPESGRSALHFISAVTLLSARTPWGPMLSGSGGDGLPSTIFVAPDNLGDPWDTSNHLFHEGLHLKLFDVGRVFSLARPNVPDLLIPWRPERWTFVRAVYSLHVYAHMLLYKAAVTEVGPSLHGTFGDPAAYPATVHPLSGVSNDPAALYGTTLARARYMVDQMYGEWSAYLTPDGRRLVDWLCAVTGPFGLAGTERSPGAADTVEVSATSETRSAWTGGTR
jgi:hypothetical protein